MAKSRNSLVSLIQSLEVKDPKTGEVIQVPINALDNRTANQIMAARIRGIIEGQIQKYNEDEIKFVPKEIRDLVEAAKSLAEFSGKLYEGEANLPSAGEKPVHPASAPTTVDFSKFKDAATKPDQEKPSESSAGP